jgi:hypothetical protein
MIRSRSPTRIALDQSSRSYDQDGHLRVENNVLTAVGVSPYVGSEIPDADTLGLNPFSVYQLLRPADELKRGAPSLAGKPVLMRHVPISANTHPYDDVAGAVGSDVAFDGKVVTGSLTFWTADSIAAIESGEMRDVSCGYWFAARMQPGTFEGVAYDGVMTGIAFNHLAIVIDGRVPGAMVGDSALKINTGMTEMDHLTTAVVRRMQDIDKAREAVRPLVGDLSMAFDSADQVFVAAMEGLGRDCRDIKGHVGAATAIWPLFRKNQAGYVPRPPALDAKTSADAARFPGAAKLKQRGN